MAPEKSNRRRRDVGAFVLLSSVMLSLRVVAASTAAKAVAGKTCIGFCKSALFVIFLPAILSFVMMRSHLVLFTLSSANDDRRTHHTST
jgi:hypothetical protein